MGPSCCLNTLGLLTGWTYSLLCSLSILNMAFSLTFCRCQLKYHFLIFFQKNFFIITLTISWLVWVCAHCWSYHFWNTSSLRARALLCSVLNSRDLRLCGGHEDEPPRSFYLDREALAPFPAVLGPRISSAAESPLAKVTPFCGCSLDKDWLRQRCTVEAIWIQHRKTLMNHFSSRVSQSGAGRVGGQRLLDLIITQYLPWLILHFLSLSTGTDSKDIWNYFLANPEGEKRENFFLFIIYCSIL